MIVAVSVTVLNDVEPLFKYKIDKTELNWQQMQQQQIQQQQQQQSECFAYWETLPL